MAATRVIDDHIELANIGTKTHAQIDTHIADPSAHHIKYMDAEAVAAVLADDKYIKNDEDDIMHGEFECERSLAVREKTGFTNAYFLWLSSAGYARFKMKYDYTTAKFIMRDDLHSFDAYTFDGEYHEFMGKIRHSGIRDATLSGTPKLFVFYVGTTPYYIKGYPTKT